MATTDGNSSLPLGVPVDVKKLSKKEIHRQEKKRLMLLKKAEFREKRIEKNKRRRKANKESGSTVSRKKLKENSMKDSLCRIRVAVDCSFNTYMNDREITKLDRQLARCYSVNRRASNPFQFYICSIGGELKARMDSIGDYLNWDVYRHTEGYKDIFDKSKIVYLTGDSPNVLRDLNPDHVYVVGGLIDHNHQKGLCLKLAQESDIAHAKLPLAEFVSMKSRPILSINHVFEILLRYYEIGDWKRVFLEVLPQRKGVSDCAPANKPHLTQQESPSQGEDAYTAGDSLADERTGVCENDLASQSF